jgi:hypothetical protein
MRDGNGLIIFSMGALAYLAVQAMRSRSMPTLERPDDLLPRAMMALILFGGAMTLHVAHWLADNVVVTRT